MDNIDFYKEVLEELNFYSLTIEVQRTINHAAKFITEETNIWHLNSPKKVSAAIYLKSKE